MAQINHPGDGETRVAGVDFPFIGVATDPQDGQLTGASLVWTSDQIGQIGTGESFSTSLPAGVHVITLTATDSDGNTGTASVTLNIYDPDGGAPDAGPGPQSPIAKINHPGNGETRVAGVDFPFIGTGTDPQDGTLSGASLVWTSDIDGPLGTGGNFTRSLSAGTHTITLTATDSQGNTGTDSITLYMVPPDGGSAPTPDGGTPQNPVATINHPGNGETRVAGVDFPFIGVANDPQDGTLSGASLVWTSNIDGQLGTGGNLTRSLSVGVNVVTLTATDSDGNTGTDSITLYMVYPDGGM